MTMVWRALTMPAALICVLLSTSAQAARYSLSVSGTIESSNDPTISIRVGTPWTLDLIYETSAPDLDFEATGSPDPTFGRFLNMPLPEPSRSAMAIPGVLVLLGMARRRARVLVHDGAASESRSGA